MACIEKQLLSLRSKEKQSAKRGPHALRGPERSGIFAFALLRAKMFQKCGPRPQEKPEIEENPHLGTPPKNKFLTLEGSALLFDTRTLKHVIMREKPKCSSQGYLSKVRLKA